MAKEFFTSYAFTANYIIGIGILSLPTAMYYGGTILSTIFFFVVGWISAVFMLALTETIGRGVEVIKWKKYQRSKGNLSKALLDKGTEYVDEITDLLKLSPIGETAEDAEAKELSEYDDTGSPTFLYSENKVIEITALARIFCGRVTEIIYFICVMVFIMCGMWNYSCVFIQSIVTIIPVVNMTSAGECRWSSDVDSSGWSTGCENAYYIYGCCYMVIVGVLSSFELKEQKGIQIALTILRIVAILVMCITSIIAMYQAPFLPNEGEYAEPPYYSGVPLVNFPGLGTLVSMTMFAYLTHHSTPGILSLLGKKNANKTVLLFDVVFFSIAGLYSMMAICLSMYFGENVNTISTMMWYDYNGKDFSGGPKPWWGYIISYIVILFPPLDLLSVYPLNSITVGNSLRLFCEYNVNLRRKSKGKTMLYFDKRWIIILFRIVVVVIPTTLSLFVRNIQVIIEVTGLLAFFIMFFGPAFFLLMSRKQCYKIWGGQSKVTPYNTWMTNSILIIALCCVGLAAFIYTIVSFCLYGL